MLSQPIDAFTHNSIKLMSLKRNISSDVNSSNTNKNFTSSQARPSSVELTSSSPTISTIISTSSSSLSLPSPSLSSSTQQKIHSEVDNQVSSNESTSIQRLDSKNLDEFNSDDGDFDDDNKSNITPSNLILLVSSSHDGRKMFESTTSTIMSSNDSATLKIEHGNGSKNDVITKRMLKKEDKDILMKKTTAYESFKNINILDKDFDKNLIENERGNRHGSVTDGDNSSIKAVENRRNEIGKNDMKLHRVERQMNYNSGRVKLHGELIKYNNML